MASGFDDSLRAAWERVKSTPGVFRNAAYDATLRRPLCGAGEAAAHLNVAGVLVQFNSEHIKTKRAPGTPQSNISVVRPFDGSKGFNFTKAGAAEVLAVVREGGDLLVGDAAVAARDSLTEADDVLFVNVNPLLPVHGLLTPRMLARWPQVLCREGLSSALRFAALATRPDLRVGFNSLGAWASVNHLHFHTFFVGETFTAGVLPVEQAETRSLLRARVLASTPVPAGDASAAAASGTGGCDDGAGCDWHLVVDFLIGWPSPGFKFAIVQQAADAATGTGAAATAGSGGCRLSSARECLASVVDVFVGRYLLPANTAHNVLVADAGRSVYVLPRQLQRGGGAEAGVMAVALAEICGLAIVYTEDDYAGAAGAAAADGDAPAAGASVAALSDAAACSAAAGLALDTAAGDGAAGPTTDGTGCLGAMTPERYCAILRDFALSDEELRLLADGITTVIAEATGTLTLVSPAAGSS